MSNNLHFDAKKSDVLPIISYFIYLLFVTFIENAMLIVLLFNKIKKDSNFITV